MQYCGMHFNHLTIPTDKFSHISSSQMIINTTGDIYILKESCFIEGMWDLREFLILLHLLNVDC